MGTSADVTLVGATSDEAEAILEASLLAYAEDLAASTDGDLDRALAHGREVVGGVLPEGVATRGHSWRWIVADGERIGRTWFGPPPDGDSGILYVWEIEIAEDARGRGLGGAALEAIVAEAERRRLGAVRLNVFTANPGARRLYTRHGFEALTEDGPNVMMQRTLRRED
jgi:ribosomal protein S18 acetylase RimI-like enzyme